MSLLAITTVNEKVMFETEYSIVIFHFPNYDFFYPGITGPRGTYHCRTCRGTIFMSFTMITL